MEAEHLGTDDLRVLRYIPFEEIHLKVLGFYCTNYDKTFDFLQHMNPAHVTPRVAREIFALEPELFYNLPDHAKNEEMCRRAVWHDGSYHILLKKKKVKFVYIVNMLCHLL